MNFIVEFVAIFVFPVSTYGALICKTPMWELSGDICYKPIRYKDTNGVNYREGRELCIQEDSNASLLMPQTESQQMVVKRYEMKVGWVWLGLTSTAVSDVWMWDDDTVMTYASWNLGEPNNADENCVSLAYGNWHDNFCSAIRGVVCQINATDTDDTNDSLFSLTSKHVTTDSMTTSRSCSCDCQKQQTTSHPDAITHVDTTDLKVDKTLLSSNIRKKSSAIDTRKSSFYIGCLGVVIILFVVLFIIILDFLPRPDEPKRKAFTRIDSYC